MRASFLTPVLVGLLWPYAIAQVVVSNPSGTCQQLSTSLAITNVTVNVVEHVTAGTNLALPTDYNTGSCGYGSVGVPVDMCRVAMNVATSERSGVTVEVWLPTNWTGRFLSTGNGGLAGCLNYGDMSYALGLGFSTVGANGGQNGTSGIAFLNNLDVVNDFAANSVHTGVVVGKQISQQYYGQAQKKSYYLGCSTGGRQGFKAVQTYPEDFDGVVAGAPAIDFIALTSWQATPNIIFGASSSPTFIPKGELWSLIHQEILSQCDALDGAIDGIIEDPTLCQFRPEALLCVQGNTNSSACLTSPQVAALRQIYTDYYGLDGELIYPRMQPGSELSSEGEYYTSGPFPYAVGYYRYVVYNDPNWDVSTYTRADYQTAAAQNPSDVQTFDSDLSAFQKNGGKLLHYHGGADWIITSDNSNRYYNLVASTMNLASSDIDDFYRYFRISGMGHCGGGDGAHRIGQVGSEATTFDSQNNVLVRMVDWVENGNAPDTVTGTKYVNDDPSQGVAFKRNHCRYPLRNVYVGPQSYTDPDAWKCLGDSF